MKIFIVHNKYLIRGGEDVVVEQEIDLLLKYSHKVEPIIVSNEQIKGLFSKLLTAFGMIFSFKYYDSIGKSIRDNASSVMHVHNTFPLISPSVFFRTKADNTPSILTLHNYRIICPTAILSFNGKASDRSVGNSTLWALKHKTYKNSYVGTLLLIFLIELHKKMGTWTNKVDAYICLTEFSKNKFIKAGLPERKIHVKPNFIEDPSFDGNLLRHDRVVFVGRLSEEKGIQVLLDGWKYIDFQLDIFGEGSVDVSTNSKIFFLGLTPKTEVLQAIKSAQFVVVPSICYEGFPMAIVEAFACGTPVLCSRLGSMEEIVEDGVTGLHFEAGNARDLAEKAQWLIDNPERAREMGQNARNEYLAKYTPEKNYEMLMDIYQQAIDEAKKGQ